MDKWIWRFLHEHDAMWRKLIVAKYYSPSCLWSTITCGLVVLLHGGLFVRPLIWWLLVPWFEFIHFFLEGPWINWGVLSTAFPRLFRVAHYPDIQVAIVWIVDSKHGIYVFIKNLMSLKLQSGFPYLNCCSLSNFMLFLILRGGLLTRLHLFL